MRKGDKTKFDDAKVFLGLFLKGRGLGKGGEGGKLTEEI